MTAGIVLGAAAAIGLTAVAVTGSTGGVRPGVRAAAPGQGESGSAGSDADVAYDGSVSAAEWPAYGRDAGGMRHVPAAEITRENVDRLRVAWVYRTGDVREERSPNAAFQATPILVDGTLYLSTPYNRVIALDPETGEERWVYDPRINRRRGYSELTSRGVSAWLDPERGPGEPCRRRIFAGTVDARLIALDGETGRPCEDFGRRGQVDLTRGAGPDTRPGAYGVSSPPAVIHDLVVIGSYVSDNQRVGAAHGVVRAFDARTGRVRWRWDAIPRGGAEDPARGTWADGSADRTGAANVWSIMAADPERDLLFVPTSSPSPDFYGGERLGSNLYANSLVALRGSTGERVWHFQVVHHDLWDYDIPAQPALFTVRRGGREIPAVAQATKMGHLFLFERETGEPLFPIEERPVPASAVPGEHAWPTQPFPTLPPPLVPQGLTADDAWGPTDERRQACRELMAGLRSEGMFTPPSLEGTILFPGNIGGSHWGGVAVDPGRGLVVTNTNRLATVVRLIPRAEFDRARRAASGRPLTEYAPQAGTPYGMERSWLMLPDRMPCSPPPWGALTAVDAATGEIRWEVPLGHLPGLERVPGAEAWGSPNLGGPITTAGGLVFVAAALDDHIRAFDIETGREQWKHELPAGGQATPMSYRLRPDGPQYVVIAAGGHGKLGTTPGDYVVAFTLDGRIAPGRDRSRDARD